MVLCHQDQVCKRINTSTNVTNSDNCIEEDSLSAPSIVTASVPNDTVSVSSLQHPPNDSVSVSSRQRPHQEHHVLLRYRDSGR